MAAVTVAGVPFTVAVTVAVPAGIDVWRGERRRGALAGLDRAEVLRAVRALDPHVGARRTVVLQPSP